MSIEVLLNEFKEAAASPAKLLKEYKAAGKKVVGVLPYYAPEELVYAAGIVPMGIWGSNTKTINRAAALAVIAYVPGLSGQGDAPLTESQAAGWEMFDAGIAAQTFCLAARDLGIGTCILGIFDAGAAGRLLELEGLRPACLIAMGYPEQWKNGPGRKETEELLSFR